MGEKPCPGTPARPLPRGLSPRPGDSSLAATGVSLLPLGTLVGASPARPLDSSHGAEIPRLRRHTRPGPPLAARGFSSAPARALPHSCAETPHSCGTRTYKNHNNNTRRPPLPGAPPFHELCTLLAGATILGHCVLPSWQVPREWWRMPSWSGHGRHHLEVVIGAVISEVPWALPS